MSSLWVYGDSFSCHHKDGVSWTDDVSTKLNLTLRNHAVSGASDETSIKRFHSNLPQYRPGDVVVFQISSHGRLHLEFQINRPETAAGYQHEVDTTQKEHEWYKDNKHHIEWLLVNQDRQMAIINQEAYIAILRNFADCNPNITVLILQNQVQMLSFPMSKISNFIRSPISLFKVSQSEYETDMSYFNWVKYTKYDPRNNHLTNTNGRLLASMVADIIHTRNVELLSYDRFVTKILPVIKNSQVYHELIEADLLHYNPEIQKYLK